MPESDRPAAGVRGEVVVEPGEHVGAQHGVVRLHVEADEVDVSEIPRKIALGARRIAAALGGGREAENVEVRHAGVNAVAILRGLVVAEARPDRALPEHLRIGVEEGGLEFGIRAGVVGVVAQEQDHVVELIGVARVVGVADSLLVAVLRPRIAEHPDAHGTVRSRDRRSHKQMVRVVARERGAGRADGVEILGVWLEAAHAHLVLGRDDRIGGAAGQHTLGGAGPDHAVRRRFVRQRMVTAESLFLCRYGPLVTSDTPTSRRSKLMSLPAAES